MDFIGENKENAVPHESERYSLPRMIVAGLAGDSGKTLVTLGLCAAFRSRYKMNITAFKKGPDYIDAAWLSAASGKKARNLDSFLMDRDQIVESFVKNSMGSNLSIIEGNRGLFDGVDSKGSHSTASLAELLHVPVLLIINVVKCTRTAAAMVLGCQKMSPNLNFIGIIINRYSTERHRRIVIESIENRCGLPVLGAIPGQKNESLLPSRHLGLITPAEHRNMKNTIRTMGTLIQKYVDLDKIMQTVASHSIFPEEIPATRIFRKPVSKKKRKIKVGYFSDSAFTFYYPENLELLEDNGAELIPVSSLKDEDLKGICCLYIGGGFPETHAEKLSGNHALMTAVRESVNRGLPVYAECGGLVYLSSRLIMNDESFEMANVFPVVTEMRVKPQGHGYSIARVKQKNPFYELDTEIKGHEFHYSTVSKIEGDLKMVLSMKRGTGSIDNKDGLLVKNAFACYIHVHGAGLPQWSEGIMKAAYNFRTKSGNI